MLDACLRKNFALGTITSCTGRKFSQRQETRTANAPNAKHNKVLQVWTPKLRNEISMKIDEMAIKINEITKTIYEITIN